MTVGQAPATAGLVRALESVYPRSDMVRDYHLLEKLQDVLDGVQDPPPCPEIVGKAVRHLVSNRGDEPALRHGMAQCVYSALRSDDRAILVALLDAGVDPNWQPSMNSSFPGHPVMSLLTIVPPCWLTQDEAFERIRLVARAGCIFQDIPDPVFTCSSLIAWPVSFEEEPTPYQVSASELMIELEYDAGREPTLDGCSGNLVAFPLERVAERLPPILARVNSHRLAQAVPQPGLNPKSQARL